MNEFKNYYPEWKKPDKKSILYDSSYQKKKYRKYKLICINRHFTGYLRMRVRARMEGLKEGTKKHLGAISMILPWLWWFLKSILMSKIVKLYILNMYNSLNTIYTTINLWKLYNDDNNSEKENLFYDVILRFVSQVL